MFISGCIPFRNKKEKLAAWKELMQEFNGNVKVIIQDHTLIYTAKVSRSFL